jgi:hypothetical protein
MGWSKEKYKKDNSIVIRDTTRDCIGNGDIGDMDEGNKDDIGIDSVGMGRCITSKRGQKR